MKPVKIVLVGSCIAGWLAALYYVMRKIYHGVMPTEFLPFEQRVGYNIQLALAFVALAGVIVAMSFFLSFVFPRQRKWIFAVGIVSIFEIVLLYWANDAHWILSDSP